MMKAVREFNELSKFLRVMLIKNFLWYSDSLRVIKGVSDGQASLMVFGAGNRIGLCPRGRIVDSRLSLLTTDSTQPSSQCRFPL